MTPEAQQRERERRNAMDRERRWAKGVTPRAMSLSSARPWDKHDPKNQPPDMVSPRWLWHRNIPSRLAQQSRCRRSNCFV